MTQVTATRCDGCGVIREGYAAKDWLTLELNRMPTLEHKAHFCPECAPKVIDAIRYWFPSLKTEGKLLQLPSATAAVKASEDSTGSRT